MEKRYIKSRPETWKGRLSAENLYLHEKVNCIDAEKDLVPNTANKTFALLGYACDEGVNRNQGRIGASQGPDALRKQLGKLPNHLPDTVQFWDLGDIACADQDMEASQAALADKVKQALHTNAFTIIIGGGHDIAFGHYCGLRNYLVKEQTLGIINFDAHFDLRNSSQGNNSGTPFYQIARDCNEQNIPFHYLCLGIRKDANTQELYDTARNLGVTYLERDSFDRFHSQEVAAVISSFLSKVDTVYVTIDMDGFSSAFAPGVSAASPMGYSPDIVVDSLELIIRSGKLISVDVAELNPTHDRDEQTAKLAASLLHFVMHEIALL
jgi:formiminoglutamase